MDKKKAVIFGDSVMRGLYWDEEAASYKIWKNPYLESMQEHLGVELVNHSQVGCTVERGEVLIDKALEKGLDCGVVILEYGGNDSDYDWAAISTGPKLEHWPRTPLGPFRDCYLRIIEKLRRHYIIPVIMALPPIDAMRYFNWFSRDLNRKALQTWLNDIEVIYRHQEAYSLEAERIARLTGCRVLDLRQPMLVRHDLPALMSIDGIHPSPAGYELLWQEIEKFYFHFLSK